MNETRARCDGMKTICFTLEISLDMAPDRAAPA
jgi:hypothetical protein